MEPEPKAPPRTTIRGQHAYLPPELILQAMDCLVPCGRHVILPPKHIITKTLVALTTVSRATYTHASRLLRQHCVHIDSSQRLATYLLCVPRMVPTLPPVLSLGNVTSLYLGLFGAPLDDQPTAECVRELLCEVSDSLRRLVVHMQFSSLDPLEDHVSVRRTLREGFEQLTKVEEFTCLAEYPALSVPEAHTDVWRLWPDLKRLTLFGVPLDNHWLWWDIATLPELRHVVLAQPQRVDVADIKDEYFHKLPRDDPRLGRMMRIVLLDAAYKIGTVRTARWSEVDPEGKMEVETYEVPRPFYGDESDGELVTEWVRRGALDGTLWEWKGDRVA
ncbi:uncharacterized protein MAM_02069 [Metarhizium album ARSEF 1941]|uniref:Uncharacterized protein n=1 Tax=Metarhizium album (strain ARSEF 1941) TaxID=1081103 RepID=A0A0B2X4B1_METAS|nr:uncharacterized protein MAM_02069 [Metarhizium album ARSEF 1941]KHO00146.1 hypothetical protein MAM_02069 [Metarhizium album ARSEF 1941]